MSRNACTTTVSGAIAAALNAVMFQPCKCEYPVVMMCDQWSLFNCLWPFLIFEHR